MYFVFIYYSIIRYAWECTGGHAQFGLQNYKKNIKRANNSGKILKLISFLAIFLHFEAD